MANYQELIFSRTLKNEWLLFESQEMKWHLLSYKLKNVLKPDVMQSLFQN